MKHRFHIGVALLIGVLTGLTALPLLPIREATAAQEKHTARWDFKVVRFYGLSNQQKTKQLNELADEGWEYVGLLSTNGSIDSGEVAFKRPRK
jgi:hypothetical protein